MLWNSSFIFIVQIQTCENKWRTPAGKWSATRASHFLFVDLTVRRFNLPKLNRMPSLLLMESWPEELKRWFSNAEILKRTFYSDCLLNATRTQGCPCLSSN